MGLARVIEISSNSASFTGTFKYRVDIVPATIADKPKKPAVQEVAGQNQLTPEVAQAQVQAELFARRVAHIPTLEGVYVSEEDGDFNYYVVGNYITIDQRHYLHDVKWQIVSQLPDVGLDLRIIDMQGRPLADMLSVEYFDAAIDLADWRERKNA
jgi:hypothetical protein